MKKKLFKISFIALVSLSFFSCNFASGDDDLLNAPSVDSTETSTHIVVVHNRLSSTNKRVNIERIEASNTSAKPVIIATLFPDKIESSDLIYQDSLIHKGKKYKYRFVFIDSETKKYYTQWSSAVQAKNGYAEGTTPNLTYKIPNGVVFSYDIQNNNITIDGGTLPSLNDGNSTPVPSFANDFSPVLILKAGNITTAFDLTDTQTAGTTSFELRNLPLTYNDKPIYCLGIAAKYDVIEKSSDHVRTEWTEIAPIKVVYAASTTSEEAKYLYIKSSTNIGTPYD